MPFSRGRVRSCRATACCCSARAVSRCWRCCSPRRAGCEIIITSSSDDKLERAKALGADYGVNYKTQENWACTSLRPMAASTRWVEVGGAGTAEQSMMALRHNGEVALIGVLAPVGGPNPRGLMMTGSIMRGIFVGSRRMAEKVADAFDVNKLKPVIGATSGSRRPRTLSPMRARPICSARRSSRSTELAHDGELPPHPRRLAWRLVLRAAGSAAGGEGHVVVAPTLPGIGGSDRELAGTTLDQWAAFVVEQAHALPGPVIVVGHSRGGIAISAAAELDPGAFAALVYLAAFLVSPGPVHVRGARELPAGCRVRGRHLGGGAGCCTRHCTRGGRPFLLRGLSPHRPGLGSSAAGAGAARADGDAPACSARHATDRCRAHYIECLADAAIPIAQQRAMQAALPCASVTTLASAHSPFLSMPDQLADALDTLAKRIDA